MVKYCSECGTKTKEIDKFCKNCGMGLVPESNDNIKLLKFLETESNRLEYHGGKIWEEMKHFSWALYVLLAAPFLLKNWNNDEMGLGNSLIIIILPILALIISIIAILIIWRESKHFDDAKNTVTKIKDNLDFYEMGLDEKPDNDRSICNFLLYTSRGYFIWYFDVLIAIGVLEFFWIISK